MAFIKFALIANVLFIFSCDHRLLGQARERLYKTHKFTSSANPIAAPFNYLELFSDGTLKWYKNTGIVNGSYVWNNGRLLLKSLKPADGEVTGDKNRGQVIFRWQEDGMPKVLEMCITSGMNFPSRDRCQ